MVDSILKKLGIFSMRGLNRSVRALSSKQILVSTCLLLVLASGITMQIVGKPDFPSPISVTVCMEMEGPGNLAVLINEVPFCIVLTEPLGDGVASALGIQLVGDVYVGPCDDLGDMIGTFTGSLSLEGPEDEFIAVLDFTMTGPDDMIIHSESKFTGEITGEVDTVVIANLENVVSEYAYVRNNGDTICLKLIRLQPESGEIIIDEGSGIICLPAFVFEVIPCNPVGGIYAPNDKLSILTPYIALVGLIGAISTIFVIVKKRGA
jgi:hypothetical protein